MAFLMCWMIPFLFIGCHEPQADATAIGQQDNVSADARKAELLRLLERKFENPDAHFQLAQLYHAEGQWVSRDHVVVAGPHTFSFAEAGLLPEAQEGA